MISLVLSLLTLFAYADDKQITAGRKPASDEVCDEIKKVGFSVSLDRWGAPNDASDLDRNSSPEAWHKTGRINLIRRLSGQGGCPILGIEFLSDEPFVTGRKARYATISLPPNSFLLTGLRKNDRVMISRGTGTLWIEDEAR